MENKDDRTERPSKLRRFLETSGRVLREGSYAPPVIPLEEINEKTISQVITGPLGYGAEEGKDTVDWALNVRNILPNIGYPINAGEDPYDVHLNVYRRVNEILRNLVRMKMLEIVPYRHPEEVGERIGYKVIDVKGLQRIAKGELDV